MNVVNWLFCKPCLSKKNFSGYAPDCMTVEFTLTLADMKYNIIMLLGYPIALFKYLQCSYCSWRAISIMTIVISFLIIIDFE